MPNETKAIADLLYDPTSTPDEVAQAGEEMFLIMYQTPLIQLLLEIVHQGESQSSFSVTDQRCSEAILFRVYSQTQQWLDYDSLNPEAWGWV
ncbi:hypothetical protein PR048_015157 [Dryococelus australis]|uniref:Uncharacterized protein n=1 Tax=Dryococelus australis TaxID=614101 RepID=A0ABQ9HGE9_9NEOP|nr:hypothetical protein PR048_015157 [Dryococelus australis]